MQSALKWSDHKTCLRLKLATLATVVKEQSQDMLTS
jgi:hypothetical protein